MKKEIVLANGDVLTYDDEKKDIVIGKILSVFCDNSDLLQGENLSSEAEENYDLAALEAFSEIFEDLNVNFIQKDDGEDEV